MPPSNQNNAKATKDLDKAIGKKVNELRLNKKITRQELAKQIGVTHQQLQKYVNGINRITVSRLVDIAHILDAPIMYFLTDDANINTLDATSQNQETITAINKFNKINNQQQKESILNLIDLFLEKSG